MAQQRNQTRKLPQPDRGKKRGKNSKKQIAK